MKTNRTSLFARTLATVLIVLCLVSTLTLAAFAETTTNQAVMADTSGVVQIRLVYIDPNNREEYNVQSGTGFLINDSTVITCNHVVTMTPGTLQDAAAAFGVDTNTVQNNCQIKISVLRDLTIEATIKNSSVEMDYAILNLSSQLYDRTYLPIRSSSTVEQTEEAFSLGFPGEVVFFQDVNTYTSDDVTITSGRVNKLNTVGGVDYIQTSTRITSGNSGCPLVDANGAVIGICQGSTGEGFDNDYFYAIAIDQLTKSLDALGIDYTKWESAGSVTAPIATPVPSTSTPAQPEQNETPAVDKGALSALITDMQSIEAKDYSESSGTAFSEALSNAQSVLSNDTATQEQVNAALDSLNSAFSGLEAKTSNTMFYIIIAGVIAGVAVIVIVIVLIAGGKKKAKVEAVPSTSFYQDTPAPAPVAVGAQAAPAQPSVFTPPSYHPPVDPGAGETTVLSQGAGETTVLNQGSTSGTLVRSKTKETIRISGGNFVIGKERSKVNYCVTDNTSVSRAHAAFRVRAGAVYVVDLKATNGTFVNGVRLTPGQEVILKNGDVILLADEEFTYHI